MKNNGFNGFNYSRDEKIAVKMGELRRQLSELGINSTGFDTNDNEYEKDIKEAKKLLYRGETVPDEIRKRLLERKHTLNNNSRTLFENGVKMQNI